MIIYQLSTDAKTGEPGMTRCDALPAGAAVVLGNFDGVHLGHRKLFWRARSLGLPATVVWTFTTLAKPAAPAPHLTDTAERLRQFASCGADYAVLEEFSAVQNLSPAEFVKRHLLEKLHAGAVVCGFNFRFGKGGAGDAELLRDLLREAEVPVWIEDAVFWQNRIVSSSAVRGCVLEGDMETAAALLGRPFSICFPVVRGKQLGRTIGIPTINQQFPAGHIIPRRGIYACTCTVGGDIFLGVANVGVRPTVTDGNAPVNCETHIINYNGLLYGKEIRVEFLRCLRPERRFGTMEELHRQIERDIATARELLSGGF